jgi:alpha-mannosidase
MIERVSLHHLEAKPYKCRGKPISSPGEQQRTDRRSFLQILLAGAVSALSPSAIGQQATERTPLLYYMDGIHGGIRGHMPPGSWRDILNALAEFPDWKISLDIEPSSWEVLKREDPQAFAELGKLLRVTGPGSRVEMVAGTFAQPYGWAISGESNIRQLQRGLQIIHEQFPGVSVSTYAVQEPCWSSCMPQVLRSFQFDGASLRDASTAWGGYTAGKDVEMVSWVGPDGSAIPAVPRYAIERLQQVYETESIDATPEFARRSVDRGIRHPSGMCFQDLGWPAKPRVSGPHIRFMTWREYIHGVAQSSGEWRFSIEDILVTLPWGDPTLRVVGQQVRSAETKLVYAEKIAALAFLKQRAEWPAYALQDAWDRVMLSQAHDAWITATTRKGRQAWAFEVAANTLAAEEAANEIAEVGAAAMSPSGEGEPQVPLGSQWLRVINTLAFEREDLAQLSIATDPGTRSFVVQDAMGNEVPSQMKTTRKYLPQATLSDLSQRHAIVADDAKAAPRDAGINHAVISFRAKTPSLGYSTYKVVPVYEDDGVPKAGLVFASTAESGMVTLESDRYRVQIDPMKGGAITSLFAKDLQKDFCEGNAKYLFNEYRGYFIGQKQWCSSTQSSATVTIVEAGPLRSAVMIDGTIGGAKFQTRIELVQGQRRIDFHTRFVFDRDTWIGDPVEVAPDKRRSEPRRSQNDGRWKLQALFPTSLTGGTIYKNAAFDVCRSRNQDTYFQGWDEIKHNIIVDWVDLLDEEEKYGLAVFSDHTTAYTHGPDHPLSLVMGWAWDGGFWWGKSVLRGEQEMSYSVVPHAGRWDKTLLSLEHEQSREPLHTSLIGRTPLKGAHEYSLLHTTTAGLEVSALLIERGAAIIRFYNAESAESKHAISFAERPKRVESVALDGRVLERCAQSPDGRTVNLEIPQFGIKVIRCTW